MKLWVRHRMLDVLQRGDKDIIEHNKQMEFAEVTTKKSLNLKNASKVLQGLTEIFRIFADCLGTDHRLFAQRVNLSTAIGT